MSEKGQKNLSQTEKWNELKKRVNMTLTRTSIDGLEAIAAELGLSRSKLMERIGRGMIPIHPETDEHPATGKSDSNGSAD